MAHTNVKVDYSVMCVHADTQSSMKCSVITALLFQDSTQMIGLLFQHRAGHPGIVHFSLYAPNIMKNNKLFISGARVC